jgi:hypothetical protein
MKKFFKQAFYGFILFAIINVLILAFYEYPAYKAIQNKTHKNYLKWNDIHTNKNQYDVITLGSSRTYSAFNPRLLDSSLNLNTYNMGTSAQDIAESYYAFKEILDFQKPKYVVLELYFDTADDNHDYYQIYSNASFFKSSKHRYNLITDGYGSTGVLNYALPVLKFSNYIKQDLLKLFSEKKKKETSHQWIKGYFYDTTMATQQQIKAFEPIKNFNNTSFNEARFKKFFFKIKALAEANNIILVYLRTPYPPSRQAITKIHDERDYYKKFSKEQDIKYYDLNSYLNYKYSDSDFSDYHHPNANGALKASQQLVEIIKENKPR